MAVSVKCTGVSFDAQGQLFINWDDGTQQEFASAAAAFNSCVQLDSDPETARKILIGEWLRQEPSGANASTHIVNKTCVFNCTSPQRITIQ